MAASAHQPLARLRPGVFGPTVSGGKPRNGGPDWPRVLLLAVTLVTGFAVITAGTYGTVIYLELRQLESQAVDITQGPEGGFVAETPGEELVVPEVEGPGDRTTILLVGSDSREGLTDEQLQAIGTDDAGTDLTDTIILLQLDPATDAAAMLSFPRDLVVTRCDGSRGRINQAYFIGEEQAEGYGPACLVDTIEAFTRIEVDHYVRVNFAGFVRAVDALGGVTFHVEEPLQDRYAGLDIPAGCVEFDGVSALQFVRARRIDNDFGRIARQQRFAREMIDQATSVGTLVNPASVTRLISSVSDVLQTDEGFGVSEMAELASGLRSLTSGAVDGRTVPATYGRLGAADVVYAIEDEAEALFEAFRTGELLPAGVGTEAEPQELGPANVLPVVVQDGSGGDGVAEETAEVLEHLGFTVSDIGEAESYGFAASLVLHPPDRADHAEVLAEALGGLSVNAGSADLEELTLILGSDFDPSRFAPDLPDDPTEGASEDPGAEPTNPADDTFVGAELSDVRC